ncbi:MAG: mandelate racemase/muconate lactonizing enzyme family protein [Granulosicoccus sp.]|nr:mandelate racemase/muconate lactonizing enzyme family protein [Granulosicoccus sp.]
MLRIKKIDALLVSVPLKQPVKMAGVVVASAENLVVKVEDTAGFVGWGESASAPTMTGELPAGMLAAARYIGSQLIDTEITDANSIQQLIEPLIYANAGAKAAIEIALLDLIGQTRQQPLYQVLGGNVRASARILTMVAGGTLEQEVENARRQYDEGFTAFKVKVGVNSVDLDLARVTAIRSALGPEVQISADANQGYSPDQALVFAKAAQDAGLDFMEQLVHGHDLTAMADCAKVSNVPLGADEGIHSIDDIRKHHKMRAASGGSIKTIKLGGLLPTLEAGHLLSSLGMSVNLAGKVAETSIASAAIAHLAMVLPKIDWATSITNQYLADDVVSKPVSIVDGAVSVPQQHGLGIQVNEDKLTQYSGKFEL